MSAKSMKQDREVRFAEPRPRRQHRTLRCIEQDLGMAGAEMVHILRRESRQERRSS